MAKARRSDPLPPLTRITSAEEDDKAEDELNGENDMENETLPGGLDEAQKQADEASSEMMTAVEVRGC